LNSKQATITDGSLTIARTSGLQTALNLKANLASPTFTGTVSGISKAMIDLGNVDNTSDLDKPMSTATQNALLNKWNVPSNASNLSNIDITSLLTSLLGEKANSNGNTYIGTHDFTGATVTGVSSSAAGPVLVYTTRTITGNGVSTPASGLPSGFINASPLTLESTDINKVVRFITDIVLQIRLPSTTDVPDGTWIGISCSSLSAARQIQIFNNAGTTQVLGSYNANPPGVASGGNGKQLIVIGGVWVALGN
jgi:hypothetical protein